jgi:hypothetical protein
MTGPINTYVSFKPVTRAPNSLTILSTGRSSFGAVYVVGVHEGDGDMARPALYLKIAPEGGEALLLRCDFSRLVNSIIGATAAETGTWEPLQPDPTNSSLWGNDQVTASIKRATLDDGTGYAQIGYHRRDRAPIRDWRVGQRIKNELCGPEWEAIELYPAESRKVDTANEYHLWCIEGQFPFGFEQADLATQAQLDEVQLSTPGPNSDGEGPVQRDNPDDDTSRFNPTHLANTVRTPEYFGAANEQP